MADKWFEFNRVFTFVPEEAPQSSVRYKPGKPYRVRQQCIDKALAVGAGMVVDTPQGNAAYGHADQSPELRSPQQKTVEISGASARGSSGSGESERRGLREESETPSGSEPEDG